MAKEDKKVPKKPLSREEAVTGKPPADPKTDALDKDSREYHVKHRK